MNARSAFGFALLFELISARYERRSPRDNQPDK